MIHPALPLDSPLLSPNISIKMTTTSVTFKTSRPPPSCTRPRIIILTRRPSCLRPTLPSTFFHRTNPNRNVDCVNSSMNALKKKNDWKSVRLSFLLSCHSFSIAHLLPLICLSSHPQSMVFALRPSCPLHFTLLLRSYLPHTPSSFVLQSLFIIQTPCYAYMS